MPLALFINSVNLKDAIVNPKEYVESLRREHGDIFARLVTLVLVGGAVGSLMMGMDAPPHQRVIAAGTVTRLLSDFSQLVAEVAQLDEEEVVRCVEHLDELVDAAHSAGGVTISPAEFTDLAGGLLSSLLPPGHA